MKLFGNTAALNVSFLFEITIVIPRTIGQALNGLSAPPRWTSRSRIPDSSSLAPRTAPPIASPCPHKYLLREWTTKSAPKLRGGVATGVAKVESTESFAPAAWAICAIALISDNLTIGLQGVSIWISLVLVWIAASYAFKFVVLTRVTWIPKLGINPFTNSAAPT